MLPDDLLQLLHCISVCFSGLSECNVFLVFIVKNKYHYQNVSFIMAAPIRLPEASTTLHKLQLKVVFMQTCCSVNQDKDVTLYAHASEALRC